MEKDNLTEGYLAKEGTWIRASTDYSGGRGQGRGGHKKTERRKSQRPGLAVPIQAVSKGKLSLDRNACYSLLDKILPVEREVF